MTPERRIVPLTFGDCTGWLHPGRSRHGVLLCGPLNHEVLPLYQSWHALAAMIAAAGLPVLRFDYHGTGDSNGGDRDRDRVAAWRASIAAAARFMREELGLTGLDLVGIRLGATFAALGSADLHPERLVLIAPVLSGRAYAREAQARSRLRAGLWRLGASDIADREIVNDGFVMTRETVQALAPLDLRATAFRPKQDILVMSEKPQAATADLLQHLGRIGCRVTELPCKGITAAMDSATLAEIPFADWREVVSFLAQDRESRAHIRLPTQRQILSTRTYVEERVVFGPDDRLAGVLCQPTAGRPIATVIFLNTGGNAHFGWGRMTIEQARILARDRVASLRMDIAGLGDAALLPRSPRAALYCEDNIADVREALDLLQARGLGNFVVVGHCSGAWLALHGALADARVRSLFLVNLQRFIWREADDLDAIMAQSYRATDSYMQEIGSGAVWRRLVKGDINWARVPGITQSMIRRSAARIANSVWPAVAKLMHIETDTARIAKMLGALSERGTGVALVYSDTDPGREELARHFGPNGRRLSLPGLTVSTIANADHDITSMTARAACFKLFAEHLSRSAPLRDSGRDSEISLPVREAA
jgi:pimeloyl-ACP methyl ester carboxylesterase